MGAPVTVVPKAYELALWLIPRVSEFPRSQRFVLGERIESAALELLDVLVEAQYRRDRLPVLQRANLTLVRLRHLVRLASDLHLLGSRRYEFISERLEELGRMVGGWIKHQQSRAARGDGGEESREDLPQAL